MGLLKTKERTPQQEAERQSQILTQIARQQEERAEADRALSRQNAARRQQLWAEQEQAREDKRMAEMARQEHAKREREQVQRETQAKLDQQKMEALRACQREVANVDQAIAQLTVPHDLTTVEGALAASEQQARIAALRELREKADGRLLQAERAVGRHRNGGI